MGLRAVSELLPRGTELQPAASRPTKPMRNIGRACRPCPFELMDILTPFSGLGDELRTTTYCVSPSRLIIGRNTAVSLSVHDLTSACTGSMGLTFTSVR